MRRLAIIQFTVFLLVPCSTEKDKVHAASARAAEKGTGYIQAELQLRPISTQICTTYQDS